MENQDRKRPACENNDCMFQVMGDSISCSSGNPTCGLASLLEAEESCFHDNALIAATQEINKVLLNIPEDAKGRNLSFLQTKMGILLAWVEHDTEQIAGAITADSDKEAVTAALKLKL
jgi:hypothetical protein